MSLGYEGIHGNVHLLEILEPNSASTDLWTQNRWFGYEYNKTFQHRPQLIHLPATQLFSWNPSAVLQNQQV